MAAVTQISRASQLRNIPVLRSNTTTSAPPSVFCPGLARSARAAVKAQAVIHSFVDVSEPHEAHADAEQVLETADMEFPPTPILPSPRTMAEFLIMYKRMLEQFHFRSGELAASAGEAVLERIRVGLMALLGHPAHGVSGGSRWHTEELELEKVLWELEKDISYMHRFHDKPPARLAVQMASAHCTDAARILSRL